MNTTKNIVCPHCHTTNRIPVEKVPQKANCGKCKNSLLDTKPVNLDQDSFHKQINRNEIPVVVDFWADWCGPCKMMAPAYEETAKRFNLQVRFAKLDTEAHQNIAATYAIRSIPTMILFRDGLEIDRVSGALDAHSLNSWIKQRA